MKDKVILISVLKPIDDVRMYHKLAKTLVKEHDVMVVGSDGTKYSNQIIQLPIFKNISRLSFKRILKQYSVLKILLQNKPQVVVACAVEILPLLLLYRIFFKVKLIYDLQENYYYNIIYQDNFPAVFKLVIGSLVRINERLANVVVDKYWVAEKCYLTEIPFIKKKSLLVQNLLSKEIVKSDVYNRNIIQDQSIRLLFCGTISNIYGVLEAIKLTQKLYEIDARYQLTIIGCCSDFSLMKKLYALNYDWLILHIQATPIPHSSIINQMRKASLLLLSYQPNKSTQACIPTKMYEAWALHLPMLIQNNLFWERDKRHKQSSIFIDYRSSDISLLHKEMSEKIFYENDISDIYWEYTIKDLVD